MMRAWAENCPATRQFLMDNDVRMSRIQGTHGGGGLSRARAPYTVLMLGEVTDIPAGTITLEDAGLADPDRTSPMAPVKMQDALTFVGPNSVRNGVALAGPLEYSAREKGVQFMLNRRFTELVRERPSRAVCWGSAQPIRRAITRSPASGWKACGMPATSTSAARRSRSAPARR